MKVFVLRTFYTNDYNADCDAAIIEDTPALRAMIRERVTIMKTLKAAQPGLWSMSYWDGHATYVSYSTLTSMGLDNAFEGGDGEVEEHDIALGEDMGERIECAEMIVTDDAIYWKCVPKHSEIDLHTAEISIKYLAELEAQEVLV